MKTEDLNLKEFREPLEQALSEYERLYDKTIKFQYFPDFSLTPEKPNSARTVIPITYSGSKAGDMYAIVFLRGDGTGDAKTYALGSVKIPPELRHIEKPERVIPRSKTGVICEGFFPLFSMNSHGSAALFAVSLEELTLDSNQTVIPAWRLGQNKSEYLQAINFRLTILPRVYFTTGIDEEGNRFGDPHAIYYRVDAYDVVQVGGFLAVKDADNPLLGLTNEWTSPQNITKK